MRVILFGYSAFVIYTKTLTYLNSRSTISADWIYVFFQEIKVNWDDTPHVNNAENKKETGNAFTEKLLASDTKL